MSILPAIKTVVYTVELPSSKQKIKIRPYTVGEEKALLTAKMSNDNQIIMNTLMSVLSGTTMQAIDMNTLQLVDIEYLFLQLKKISVGENNTFSVACGGKTCDELITVTIPVDQVEYTKATADDDVFVADMQDGSKLRAKLEHPSFGVLKEMDAMDISEADSDILIIYNTISVLYDTNDNVYNKQDITFEDFKVWFEDLVADITPIEKFIKDVPTLGVDRDLKCSKCGHVNHLHLRGIKDFFS